MTEVSSAEELKNLSRAQQADLSFNTLEAWEQRIALRRHPVVREALHNWWLAVLATLRPGLAEGEVVPVVDKATYIKIYEKIFCELAEQDGEVYDEEEAREYAEEDWREESKDGRTMSREVFLQAVFEIADLHTDSISADGYAGFVSDLLATCTKDGGVFWVATPPPTPPVPVPTVPTGSIVSTAKQPAAKERIAAGKVRPVLTPAARAMPSSVIMA